MIESPKKCIEKDIRWTESKDGSPIIEIEVEIYGKGCKHELNINK